MRCGCGYHFSRKLESSVDSSGVTPTSMIVVDSVGRMFSTNEAYMARRARKAKEVVNRRNLNSLFV